MPKKKKLDICRECRKSARPAINAAKLGHANCLTTAYRELGVFNERDNFGATPIHFAARNGRLDCLVWLVTRSGVSPNAVSRNGATAAHDAAAMGHLECLQYLLKSTKCSAHDTTSEGATVLHMACRFGRLAVVEWLMEYSGSSPSEKGANDVTPVHLCAAKGESVSEWGRGCYGQRVKLAKLGFMVHIHAVGLWFEGEVIMSLDDDHVSCLHM